jgi:hypothetical protein
MDVIENETVSEDVQLAIPQLGRRNPLRGNKRAFPSPAQSNRVPRYCTISDHVKPYAYPSACSLLT